jgi:hypothetical protein
MTCHSSWVSEQALQPDPRCASVPPAGPEEIWVIQSLPEHPGRGAENCQRCPARRDELGGNLSR